MLMKQSVPCKLIINLGICWDTGGAYVRGQTNQAQYICKKKKKKMNIYTRAQKFKFDNI